MSDSELDAVGKKEIKMVTLELLHHQLNTMERLQHSMDRKLERLNESDHAAELKISNMEHDIKEIRAKQKEHYDQLHEHVTAVDARTTPAEMDKIYIRRDMVRWIAVGFFAAGGSGIAAAQMIFKAVFH